MKKEFLDAMNVHMLAELQSSYVYMSMAAWLDFSNRPGMAKWMMKQAAEEHEHALMFYRHITDRGGRAVWPNLPQLKINWKNCTELWTDTYNHEKEITQKIQNLLALARKSGEHPSEYFLIEFLAEQIEEEKMTHDILMKIKSVEGDASGMIFMDDKLGKRSGTEPMPKLAD